MKNGSGFSYGFKRESEWTLQMVSDNKVPPNEGISNYHVMLQCCQKSLELLENEHLISFVLIYISACDYKLMQNHPL